MAHPKIHCKDILYRSGIIEVAPGIHDEHVNLEIWEIHPDRAAQISGPNDGKLKDEDITAVIELELNVQQAKEMVRQLQLAIAKLEEENA